MTDSQLKTLKIVIRRLIKQGVELNVAGTTVISVAKEGVFRGRKLLVNFGKGELILDIVISRRGKIDNKPQLSMVVNSEADRVKLHKNAELMWAEMDRICK